MSNHWVSVLVPYQGRAGCLHEIDARAKLLSLLTLVLAIITTPENRGGDLILYGVFLLGLAAYGRLSLPLILLRSAALLPLLFGVGLATALSQAWGNADLGTARGLWFFLLAARSWLALLSVILLVMTTPFEEVIRGAQRLGLPDVLASLSLLSYRYLFVILEEVSRLNRAARARNFGAASDGGWRLKGVAWRATVTGHMIGSLFLRSFQRGERVYTAMLARGYTGQLRSLAERPLRMRDFLFLLSVLLAVFVIRFLA